MKYIKEGKIKVLELNTMEDIIKFMGKYYNMHLGETDVMLTYMKLKKDGIKVLCGFDEKRARTLAKELKVDVKGVVGILISLKGKKIIPLQKIKEITDALIKNNFRLSRHLIELVKSD